MALRLFNTLGRKKQYFEPLKGKHVGFYSCGPTVYWYQHIGNLRTYIFNDILKRVLLYEGFKVRHVMNVTDVGHLTSDADAGEDKMEKAAKKEGKRAADIAKFYLKVFRDDFKKLNIIEPDIWCKATEHIAEQIEIIKKLEKKGFTYGTGDGIYFDTSKLADYGKLGLINAEGLEAGKRVELGEKRNKTDFALWKFSGIPGKRQQEWESPWGIGFPGWHIECSAMSSKYLGEQFDIHTGGEDHIQVHHTNEIAQSESAFGKKPWVKYWMHGAFLTFRGEKVSKSTGGLFTISDLEKKGFEPLDYRYLCLNTHYRKQLNFSLEVLEGARNSYQKLKNIILELKSSSESKKTENYDSYKKRFQECIDDDFNMPESLGIMWETLRDANLGAKEKYELVMDFDRVFGLGLDKVQEDKAPAEILKLIEQRQNAKKEKDFKKSDEIRNKISEKGYLIEDTVQGPRIRKR